MLAGLVLREWTSLSIPGRPASAGAGAVLLLAGLGLSACGVVAIVRHRTTIVPHHAVSTLVTSGAYRLSRNPMYSGLAIAYMGGALLLGSWWPLLLLPAAVISVRRLVIDPEERYLSRRFGSDYQQYRAAVRRWL